MTFNSSNLTDADSVLVGFGLDTSQQYFVSKTIPANGGAITFTSTELSVLSPGTYGIDIIPFTNTFQYFGGNPYQFLRRKEIVRFIRVK